MIDDNDRAELRLECLKLGLTYNREKGKTDLEKAEEFFAFVADTGKKHQATRKKRATMPRK